MSLHFKLVGIEDMNKKILIYKVEKKENDIYSFDINDIFNFIVSYVEKKITDESELDKIKKEFKSDFSELKLIYDKHPINAEKEYVIEQDKVMSVYVFTSNLDIRKKYHEIFQEYGTLLKEINEKKEEKKEPELDKKLEEKLEDEDDVLSDEQVIESNSDIVNLFKDSDFINLIRIYKNKPDLFDYLSSYVSCGDILSNSSDEETSNGSNPEEFKYNESLSSLEKILKEINIEYNVDDIKKLLEDYSGFINIPLRYILYKSCNSDV